MRQQSQPSGDPCEHLRRHLPQRDQGHAMGLGRPLGTAVRFAEKLAAVVEL